MSLDLMFYVIVSIAFFPRPRNPEYVRICAVLVTLVIFSRNLQGQCIQAVVYGHLDLIKVNVFKISLCNSKSTELITQ